MFLGVVLLIEGIALIVFSQMADPLPGRGRDDCIQLLRTDVGRCYILCSSVHQPQGAWLGCGHCRARAATRALLPSDSCFRAESITYQDGFLFIGAAVLLASVLVFLVRFSPETEAEERRTMEEALATKECASNGGRLGWCKGPAIRPKPNGAARRFRLIRWNV